MTINQNANAGVEMEISQVFSLFTGERKEKKEEKEGRWEGERKRKKCLEHSFFSFHSHCACSERTSPSRGWE